MAAWRSHGNTRAGSAAVGERGLAFRCRRSRFRDLPGWSGGVGVFRGCLQSFDARELLIWPPQQTAHRPKHLRTTKWSARLAGCHGNTMTPGACTCAMYDRMEQRVRSEPNVRIEGKTTGRR